VELSRQCNVGNEGARATQEFFVFDAANRRADAFVL